MKNLPRLKYVTAVGLFLLALSAAIVFRARSMAIPLRYWEFSSAIVLTIFTIYLLYISRHTLNTKKYLACMLLAILPTCIVLYKESVFQYKKYIVLHTSETEREKLGKHFIVGFRNPAEGKKLVEQAKVGGVYLTKRNVTDVSIDELQDLISSLQAEYSGEKKLIVSTDQEGGVVQRLSPPLPWLPNMQASDLTVAEYAEAQASDLESVGVNMNFSPVVDVPQVDITYEENLTDLSSRQIGKTTEEIIANGTIYTRVMNEHNIIPTLKHFPGIGRVTEDTHVDSAHITASLDELLNSDLTTFFEISQAQPTAIMISHAILDDVDVEQPASISESVIHNLLRDQGKFTGLVVTDDFSMWPISERTGGVGQASVAALNAGVDYIVIAYDPDLYYEAMYDLLQAYNAGEVHVDQLDASQQRIGVFLKPTPVN